MSSSSASHSNNRAARGQQHIGLLLLEGVESTGVSAGIDMALHLVTRLAGTERARAIRREIQCDPRPLV